MSCADVGCFGTACPVSVHSIRILLAGGHESGYKCVQVTDPHAKRWLADDPNFLASLGDLDRGLADGEPPFNEPVEDLAVAPPLFTPPPVAAHTTRRPLLDLFPASALVPEHPADRAPGSAVGPQLLPPRPRPAPPPADTPSPLDALTYETFYGLREKPFSLSTDPRFLYPSAAFEHASQDVLAATRQRGGPIVLTALARHGQDHALPLARRRHRSPHGDVAGPRAGRGRSTI